MGQFFNIKCLIFLDVNHARLFSSQTAAANAPEESEYHNIIKNNEQTKGNFYIYHFDIYNFLIDVVYAKIL